ncbi:MAG TPA: hypothetical protein ENK47_07490, partial [Euryarchaeota archaeon]|nr:hypothetical protein [Euryarchaeota archaeon]
MVYQRYEIGIEAVDRILGGGIPSGSVLTLIGEPGTGRMDLALRFISKGFEINEPGLFVSFTSVPVTGYLKRLRGRAPFRALLETDEPLFLSTLELKGLDLVLGIIEEGAVGRLVLDRPEVLGMRNIQNWFKNLED